MEEYKQLLSAFAMFVKSYGFKRKGNRFIKETPEVFQIVEFQKSKYSTSQEAEFAINIGVTLKKVLQQKKIDFNSNLMYNNWHTRVCRPGIGDDWHQIKAGDDYKKVFEILKSVFIELIINQFEKNSQIEVLYEKEIIQMKNDSRFVFMTIENILYMTKLYFPERTDEMLVLVFEKAKDSNDRLFINEVLRELR